jgi:hypothetical protein
MDAQFLNHKSYYCLYRRLTRILVTVLLLCFIPWSFVSAEENETPGHTVIIFSFPRKQGKEETLQRTVCNSIQVEMELAGFRVIEGPRDFNFSSTDTTEEISSLNWDRFYELGTQEGADFFLAGFYILAGKDISIDFHFHDVNERRELLSVTRKGKMDLAFDRLVAEAVNEIIENTGIEITDTEAAAPGSSEDKTTLTASGEAVTVESAESTAGDSTRGDSTTKGPAAGDPESSESSESGKMTMFPVREEAATEIKHLELSLGFAPFLTVGDASEYFRIGYIPCLYGNYRFALARSRIALGIYTGLNLFTAEGIIASADSMLIPMGLDIRYSPGIDSWVNLFFRISGGPVIFALNPNQTGMLIKVIPFVLGGIGINLSFSRFIGITIDSSFSVYFEKSQIIMGYTPSLYLFVRF